MTATTEAQIEPAMVLMTSLQAVTVSLVCYLIFHLQHQQKDTVKSKKVKEDDTTVDTDSSVKEVNVQNEKRSIRGVNVYGPYKKAGLTCERHGWSCLRVHSVDTHFKSFFLC